jgi:hypothetical protein
MAQKQHDHDWQHNDIRHVLLISVDGMHAVDFLNCSQGIATINGGAPYCPNLAALGTTGVKYVAASTSKPSDSFPGLMSIVTGATPRTMGIYYDVAYDKFFAPPANTTGNGLLAGNCVPNQANGTVTEYEEGIDLNQSLLNGGAPGAGLTDGGIASIDTTKLVRDPGNGCAPVLPWNFVRTNTIFGVIHNAGGYTAWSDKHPAYSAVAGPGGGTLDDFYAPEINSNVVNLPGVTTPTGINCATVPDPNSDTSAWTNSFQNIQCYDQLKVNAVLDWIQGEDHDGNKTAHSRTPNIFGMNFQAVSVGQKFIEKSIHTKGGYLDAAGTPSPTLLEEITFVDDSIGAMVNGLKNRDLLDKTLIIITAKHGQSPIDPNLWNPILNQTNGTSPATLLSAAGYLGESVANFNGIGPTEDDVSLLWLNTPSSLLPAVQLLESNAANIGLGQIYYGPTVAMNYDVPGVGPGQDPRTPDIIVTPNVGVDYTGSSKKQEEHGGFSHDDTNVVLLVSNPALNHHTVYTNVGTNQIAPTILKALGLDPQQLDAVRLEGTAPLPDLY